MSDAFEVAWTLVKNEEKAKKKSKSKFKGYSKNRISDRAERQGKARAWSQSRKVSRKRTRMKYARNKTRGNIRPKLRRQLGAGGERIQIKKGRWQESKYGRGGEHSRTTGPTGKPLREPVYCIRPNCNRKLSSHISEGTTPLRLQQCATCLRLYGHRGLDVRYTTHAGVKGTSDVDPSDVAPT